MKIVVLLFLLLIITQTSYSYELPRSRSFTLHANQKEPHQNILQTRRKTLRYTTQHLITPLSFVLLKPNKSNAISSTDAESSYNKYAKTYDTLDGGSIADKLGIEEERTKIIQQAKGDVLEVAVGTGLNLNKYIFASSPYANDGVRTLTLLDISENMISEAKLKLDLIPIPSYVKVDFIKADATSSDITSMFGEDAFDTVLDTFSLCVMGNEGAKKCLKQMRNVVKPEAKGGRILLIENSRSSNSVLGMYQDMTAGVAANLGGKGCVSNQDVKAFIQGIDRLKIEEENEFATGLFRSYVCFKN